MAHVSEKRPGVWRIEVATGWDPQKRRYGRIVRSVKGTKRKAQAEAAKLEAQVAHGQLLTNDGSCTFEVLVQEWLSSTHHQESTKRGYESKLRNHVLPYLGNKRVSEINVRTIEGFVAHLRGTPVAPRRKDGPPTGKTLSDSTVRQCHAIVNRALQTAHRWGWIPANPAKLVSMRTPQRRHTGMGATEMGALLRAADELGGADGLGVRLAITIGARRGEIVGLQWNCIDIPQRMIHVHQAMTEVAGERKIKTTKTQATRYVAIDEETAKKLLARWNEMSRRAAQLEVAWSEDDFVLSPHPGAKLPIRGDRLYKSYRALADQLGITDMRFHDLRHGHATVLLQDGADLATVAERIGDDPVTVARFYVHGELKQQRKAIGAFAERLAGTGG